MAVLKDRDIEKTLKHPINTVQRQDYVIVPPDTTCEACGTVKPRDQMFNVIMQIGSPGHPEIPPFQCLGGEQSLGEHWACSIDCYRTVAIACLDEHMIPFLQHLHTNVVPVLNARREAALAERKESP